MDKENFIQIELKSPGGGTLKHGQLNAPYFTYFSRKKKDFLLCPTIAQPMRNYHNPKLSTLLDEL